MIWRPWVLCLTPTLLLVSCAEGGGDSELLGRIQETERRVLPRLEEWGAACAEQAMENDIPVFFATTPYANAHHGDSTANRMLVKRAELLLGRGDARAKPNGSTSWRAMWVMRALFESGPSVRRC